MACGELKSLPRRTASDKLLCYKGSNIAKNLKYDRYWKSLALVACRYFDKNVATTANKSAASGAIRREIISNQ